jgi:hypothetical protein
MWRQERKSQEGVKHSTCTIFQFDEIITLQLLNVLENLISASSLNRLGSLLTHWGMVVEEAFGIVL